MSEPRKLSEYIILSRGQWDEDKSPEEIQAAIDAFYVWIEGLIAEGKMKRVQRLAPPSMVVSKIGIMDGPFTESKEVIGGYWTFVAESLAEAAALAAQNPCLKCGLSYEVRATEDRHCSAYDVTCETPRKRT